MLSHSVATRELALSNGNPVNFWADSSTNVNDAVSLSAGGAPTYVTNGINGKPSVQFDGTTDFSPSRTRCVLGRPANAVTGGLTMIAVFRTTSADTIRNYDATRRRVLLRQHGRRRARL